MLILLYCSTGGPNWTNKSGWLTDELLPSWDGVTQSNGKVSLLSLHNNQLSGTIPTELEKLSSLENLYLHSNQLSGTIPMELGKLTSLLYLALNNNQLSGSIPRELEDLSELLELAFWGNDDLTWEGIPDEVGERADRAVLRAIYVDNKGEDWSDNSNWLDGDMPFNEWHGITEDPSSGRVKALNLSNNNLRGDITNAVEVLEDLETLNLSGNNQLTGRLPDGLTGLELETLNTGNTSICAPLNPEFQQWLQGIADFKGNNCAPEPEPAPELEPEQLNPEQIPDTDQEMAPEPQTNPEKEPTAGQGGGGGCTISSDAEAGDTSQRTVFNLLLIISALLAVSRISKEQEQRESLANGSYYEGAKFEQ